MYKVYVIQSIKYLSRYIGQTQDIDQRLKEHNYGKCRYTKGRMPWEVVYFEEYEIRTEAMRREKFLKSGQGRKFLDEKLKK